MLGSLDMTVSVSWCESLVSATINCLRSTLGLILKLSPLKFYLTALIDFFACILDSFRLAEVGEVIIAFEWNMFLVLFSPRLLLLNYFRLPPTLLSFSVAMLICPISGSY